jgi:hypothetical protein
MAGSELPIISMENMTQQIWKKNKNLGESFVMPYQHNYRLTDSKTLYRKDLIKIKMFFYELYFFQFINFKCQ